jgi:hypothetical protein
MLEDLPEVGLEPGDLVGLEVKASEKRELLDLPPVEAGH